MQPKLFLTDAAVIENCKLPTIHQRVRDNNLEALKIRSKSYMTPDMARIVLRNQIKKQKIAIHTTKGGVGKTTITLNLAFRLWTFGVRLLVIDLDQQANLTKGFDISNKGHNVIQDVLEGKCQFEDTILKVKEGLDVIPSNLKNARNSQTLMLQGIYPDDFLPIHINKISDQYDIILIDCPPALGNVIESAYHACDRVISILEPDDNALDGVFHSESEVKRLNEKHKLKIDFKVLLNKYDARTMFSNVVSDFLAKDINLKKRLFQTTINTSQEYLKAKNSNITIFDANKKTKAFMDIDNLAREVLGWPTGGHKNA